MTAIPNCPKCASPYVYEDAPLLICPECAYEWTPEQLSEDAAEPLVVKDANGTLLQDGDTVTINFHHTEAQRHQYRKHQPRQHMVFAPPVILEKPCELFKNFD